MKRWILCLLLSTNSWASEKKVPDEFASIAAAIEASASGDTILVGPGEYVGPLVIPAGVTVRSLGDDEAGETGNKRAEKTIIDSAGKAPAVVVGEGAILDGLTITGAGKFDRDEFQTHWETRGENLPDERGAVGTGQERPAVEIAGVSAVIRSCIIRDNGHAGIGVSGAGNHSQVLDNHVFRNMGGGIGIANGAAPRVAGNRCYENLRGGIGCRKSYPLIENNECYNNVRAGIGIREGATPLVRGNRCYENRRAGIGVRMEGTSPHLLENRCYRNGMAGIGCRDGASPVIEKNHLLGNRLAGIGAMSNASPVIIENLIEGNGAAAIGLDACRDGSALIYGNKITARSLVALGIQKGWTVMVENNEIQREGGMPPLAMVFAGARADFYGNTFEGSGIAAIRNAGRVFVSGNTFTHPKKEDAKPVRQALWNLDGASASVPDDNRFIGWKPTSIASRDVSTDEELRAALAEAHPGDTIRVAPGNYTGGLTIDSLQGTEAAPITLTGIDPDNPPVFSGGNSGMHLIRPVGVELRHFVIADARRNGLNIDDGGNSETPGRFLTLKHLEIRDSGSDGNEDGIKLSGIRDFRIERCDIKRWGKKGSGIDHVGCADGIISDNRLLQENLPTGSGIQAKGGSSDLRILRNRFVNCAGRSVNLGGSTGIPYFRPPDATFEARNLTVTDCHFSGSIAPIAFVGIDGGLVRHCTVENPQRWVIRILQESTDARFIPSRNGIFERNRIQFDPSQISTLVNVGAKTNPDSFLSRGNSWVSSENGSEIPIDPDRFPIPVVDQEVSGGPASGFAGTRWLHPQVRE